MDEFEELFLVDVLVELFVLDLFELDPVVRFEVEVVELDRLELLLVLLDELLDELLELLDDEDVLVETLAELLASESFLTSTN